MAFQSEELTRMRKKWGGKPCTHPSAEKEYYLGSATGDYGCSTCGETWWQRAGWRKAQERALEEQGREMP